VPRKIRLLINDLEKAGFEFEPGKGSHHKMVHPAGIVIVISGQLGDDAKHYQEKDVKEAIKRIAK